MFIFFVVYHSFPNNGRKSMPDTRNADKQSGIFNKCQCYANFLCFLYIYMPPLYIDDLYSNQV